MVCSFPPFYLEKYELTSGNRYAVIGCTIDGKGAGLLYSSPDFKSWKYEHPLYSSKNYGTVWECPDFFPIPNAKPHYLFKISADGTDLWSVGTYDSTRKEFTPLDSSGNMRRLSYGMSYASKSFHDPVKDRQIVWSWISEEDQAGPSRGWQGTMSLPLNVQLDPELLIPTVAPIQVRFVFI